MGPGQFGVGGGCRSNRTLRIDLVGQQDLRSILLGHRINQGQGFAPVNGRVDANVGDSVMVGPGGSASLVYSDGCTVDVQPGSVTTIAPLSPCASGSNAQNFGNNNNGGGFDWGGALMLGAAGAGAGLGIYESTRNGGSTSPASASP